MTSITLRAPAKINLYLAVTGKEENGYHTVETIMQAISLCDTVTVKKTPGESFSLTCSVDALPSDSNNLAWKAAMLYFDTLGIDDRCFSVYIEKHIPIAGGLAGGSTDAAAVLLALNHLHQKTMTEDMLLSCSERLGMDVPFCLLAGMGISTALGLHYGENMQCLPTMPQMPLVIASAGEGVSTPWAYALIDASVQDPPMGYAHIRDTLQAADSTALLASMYNCFEDVILPHRPAAAYCRSRLLSMDARRAMMSGSGPTVFGIFDTLAHAQAACDSLCAEGIRAWTCTTI